MPIRFFNIRSGLEAIADTEPKIAALWSSSDHSPNITQGQDLGWRLAVPVVVEMKAIKQDIVALERIAGRYRKAVEDLGEIDILHWISDRTILEKAPVAQVDQYADDYDAQVRAAELAAKDQGFDGGPAMAEPITTTTTMKSIKELEDELEARYAAEESTTTTTTENV